MRSVCAPAVVAFNARLAAGGAPWRFPTSAVPTWLPRLPGREIYQQYFLALDGPSTVRGAYGIKHQLYRIGGEERSIGQIALPLSEGVIDRSYGQVGAQLLLHALRQQPLLYALGMGGNDEPITKLVRAAGWRVITVPFQFRVVRPARFLKNITLLRRTPLRAGATEHGRLPKSVGWLACHAWRSCSQPPRPPQIPALEIEEFDEFDDRANDVWRQCRNILIDRRPRRDWRCASFIPGRTRGFHPCPVSGRLVAWSVGPYFWRPIS